MLAFFAAAAWSFRHWRQGLRLALVFLVFEGAIRKWAVPGAADFVYFGKDILLAGVFAGFLRQRRVPLRPSVPGPLVGALVGTALIGALQLFNPNLPNLIVGLLGFKAYFWYVPLLWVVPAAFADDRDLLVFLRRYLLIAIPVGVLAVVQFLSPASSRINTYAPRSGMETVSSQAGAITFGSSSQVRVTGTFSFISGFTTYLLVIALFSLAFLALGRWRLRGNLRIYVVLGLVLASMLMSGSRGPILLLIVLSPLYWLLGVVREGGIPAIGRFLVGAALVAALVNYVGADAVEAFWGRARGSSDVADRIIGPFVTPIRLAGEIGLVGYGIGSTHQTAEAVTKGIVPYSWLGRHRYEDEPTRVLVELGFLGWLFFTAMRLAIALVALSAVFRLRSSVHRVLATSVAMLALAHFMGGVVFNITGGVYYWFFAGVLMLVRRLDREQKVRRWMATRAGAAEAEVAATPPPRPVLAR